MYPPQIKWYNSFFFIYLGNLWNIIDLEQTQTCVELFVGQTFSDTKENKKALS